MVQRKKRIGGKNAEQHSADQADQSARARVARLIIPKSDSPARRPFNSPALESSGEATIVAFESRFAGGVRVVTSRRASTITTGGGGTKKNQRYGGEYKRENFTRFRARVEGTGGGTEGVGPSRPDEQVGTRVYDPRRIFGANLPWNGRLPRMSALTVIAHWQWPRTVISHAAPSAQGIDDPPPIGMRAR